MGIHVAAVLVGLTVWTGLFLYYFFRREKQIKRTGIIIMWIVAVSGMVYSYCAAIHYQLSFINCLRNALVFAWLLIIALIDGSEKLIPRALTSSGLVCWAVIASLAVFLGGDTWKSILVFSGGGLLLGGGVFSACRIFSRGGIGMGDIRMFSVLGLLYGLYYTFSILFVTVLIMTIWGIAGLISRKSSVKSMVPMGPFTLTAVCICFTLGI